MASLGIESGSVNNRTALLDAFAAWVIKTPSNHGPGWTMWDDRRALGTNPHVVVTNQSAPTPNSKAIFLMVLLDSANERIYFYWYYYWNNATHTGFLAGYTFGSNYITTTTGSFAYYFIGGDDLMFIATRIGGSSYVFRLAKGTGIWDGSSKCLEPESTSGILVSPANLVNGTATASLGAGQGANFRLNAWYFMADFTSASLVALVKVAAKSGDDLTVQYNGAKTFPAGAYISPYPLRWVFVSPQNSFLPFACLQGTETGYPSPTTAAAWGDYMAQTIQRLNPDQEGDYPEMHMWIGNQNRLLFYENESIITAPGGLAAFTDVRTISGVSWLAFDVQSNYAKCVRNQESLS